MIELAVIGVLILMACNQNPMVPRAIPTDSAVPLPPPQGDNPLVPLGSGGANPAVDETVNIRTDSGGDYLLNEDPAPPAYVDPQNPLPDASGGDDIPPGGDPRGIGDAYMDPTEWAMDPVFIPGDSDLPIKTDPVAVQPASVWSDPANPVPTYAEQTAASVDPAVVQGAGDYFAPVPTPATDPEVFVAQDDHEAPPAEDPMTNWTAQSNQEADCPPSVEVELSWDNMEALS